MMQNSLANMKNANKSQNMSEMQTNDTIDFFVSANVEPKYYKTWDQMSTRQRVDALFSEMTPEEK